MALTQAGEVYLSRLRLILAEIDEAGDQAKQHSSEISGSVRVVTTSLVAVNLLAPRVPSSNAHPDVMVETHTSDRPAQELHQFDLTIVRQDDQLEPDVVVRPVLEMNYVLCGSLTYLQARGIPRTPEDLSQHCLVRLREPGTRLPAIRLVNPTEGGRRFEVSSASSVISNDDEVAYQAALSGAGLTVLPDPCIDRTIARWTTAPGARPLGQRRRVEARGHDAQPAISALAHPSLPGLRPARPQHRRDGSLRSAIASAIRRLNNSPLRSRIADILRAGRPG